MLRSTLRPDSGRKNTLSPSIKLYRSAAQYSAASLLGRTTTCIPFWAICARTNQRADKKSPRQNISRSVFILSRRSSVDFELINILCLKAVEKYVDFLFIAPFFVLIKTTVAFFNRKDNTKPTNFLTHTLLLNNLINNHLSEL